ncbi:achaete-scute complex protein T8-like [Diabrotica virgifera virgifera]|uniref:Achaete-scute complex protein T8-like n=1 Tax=Diabrotica virgifera virgifera TaxID=50390 RepID=A0A6P7H125_DIAVI|nr:achaete-scute complex protein T8-like [Diabrotica virgifera virgifera]
MQNVHHSISCMYSQYSRQSDPWTSPRDHISTADATYSKHPTIKRPLREKNPKNVKHVAHKERPPQVVERRNARERRRVQAVNMAFVRLKKAIPYQNSRGKRLSKVKTLQNAIRYIQELEIVLQDAQINECYYKNEKYFAFANTNEFYEII